MTAPEMMLFLWTEAQCSLECDSSSLANICICSRHLPVEQTSRNRLANSIDINRWSGNKGHDEAGGGSQESGKHDSSEPTNVETVLGAGNPVGELAPDGSCILLGKFRAGTKGAYSKLSVEVEGVGIRHRLFGSWDTLRSKVQSRRLCSCSSKARLSIECSVLRSREGITGGCQQSHDD